MNTRANTPESSAAQGAMTEDLFGLLNALHNQQQCDEDGTLCQVNRQAVDEAITIIERIYSSQQPSDAIAQQNKDDRAED